MKAIIRAALTVLVLADVVSSASAQEAVALAGGDSEEVVLVGDMLLEPYQAVLADGEARRGKRARGLASLIQPGTLPWPDGILPIVFDDAITSEEKELFFDVCRGWSDRVNVKCLEKTDQDIAIKVVRGNGCNSRVGYGAGWVFWDKERTLSLGEGCWSRSIIAHELGHALGLMHEHMRPDRDDYITVLWDNIDASNHEQYKRIEGYTFGLPYDFESIMHYWSGGFAIEAGKDTFVGKPGYEEKAARAGSAQVPSALDASALHGWYGEPKPPVQLAAAQGEGLPE